MKRAKPKDPFRMAVARCPRKERDASPMPGWLVDVDDVIVRAPASLSMAELVPCRPEVRA